MFAADGETDQTALNKVSRSAGDLIGAWLGRATVPLNQVSDIISAFDSNEALPRDIYVTKPDEERTFLTAVGKNIQKGIPILKQALPEYQPATRTQAAFRDTGPLKQLTGLALVPPKNEIETEIEARKIPFNAIFSTTGDKTVDAEARKFIANNIDNYIGPVINMDLYKKATDEGKAIDLKNALSELQSEAKKLAIDQSIAQFYKMEKVPPIEQKQFEALPPKLRRITLEFYKQRNGKSLESDTDFRKYGIALEISKTLSKDAIAVQEPVKKAAGGDVKGVSKASLYENQMKKLTASKLKVISSEFREVYGRPFNPDTDYREAINLAKDVGLLGSNYAMGGVVGYQVGGLAAKQIGKEIGSSAVMKSSMSLLKEMQDAAAKTAAKEAPVETVAAPVVKEGAASAIAKTPYVKNKYGPAVSKPVEEAAPIAKQMEEAIPEAVPAKVEEPLPEIKTDLPPPEPSIYTTPVATTENLNKPSFGFDEETRKSTLSSIKVLRQESFAAIKDAPEFAGIDPSAIAVAQGEYRAKVGREFNADNPADVIEFADFAKGYQKKLEDLREQYKDMPPKILIHGTETERTPAKVKRGFFDPQTLESKKHMELDVGATSFTSDLRLNYRNEPFGGPVVKNISYTELPYADYIFRRVDMPLDAYTKKDMNTIARTITGDPTVARPLGLPRNLGYKETEDAFVESEKLKIQTDFNKIEKQYKLIEKQEKVRNILTNRLLDMVNKTDEDGLSLIDNIRSSTEKPKDVYEAYTNVKNLFKNEFRHTGGAAATKAGMLPVPDSNQTFISSLSKLAKTTNVEIIDALYASLSKSGSTDKALALEQLSKNLKTFQTIPTYLPPSTPAADIANLIDAQTKAANNIRDLISNDFRIVDPKNPKNTRRIGLAKGGLASRR